MHVRRSAEIALLVLACGAVQANAQGPTEVDPAAQDTSAVVVVEILDDRSLKIAAYSFAFYSPETELAFGAGGIATFYSSGHDPDLRPSKVSLSGCSWTGTGGTRQERRPGRTLRW